MKQKQDRRAAERLEGQIERSLTSSCTQMQKIRHRTLKTTLKLKGVGWKIYAKSFKLFSLTNIPIKYHVFMAILEMANFGPVISAWEAARFNITVSTIKKNAF